jgi:drug/metabolite transporter (DMT)-like permease
MSNQPAQQSNLSCGYLFAFISSAFLSTTAIFIRHLSQTYHVPSLVVAFWRDAFAVLTLLTILGFVQPRLLRMDRCHLFYMVGYGFVLAFFNAFWTLSVSLNGAAIATVLVYSSTAFTALLGWWILKERLDWVKLLAVIVCLGGCALVSGALEQSVWNTNLGGILAGILSGLGYAFYSLMGRSASQRGFNPWTTLFYTFCFATIFLLFFNLLPGGIIPGAATRPADIFWLGNSLVGWGILFLLAAVPTLAGFGFYNVCLGYLPSSIANLILTTEPAFTLLTAYILLGERLNAIQIIGSLTILSGVIALRVYEGWSAGKIPAEMTNTVDAVLPG